MMKRAYSVGMAYSVSDGYRLEVNKVVSMRLEKAGLVFDNHVYR